MNRDLLLLQQHYPDPQAYACALERYNQGEPLAYLLGEEYFWRYRFVVTPDVLIPRPDTERLVELAIQALPQNGRFADLCTGSGAIALSVAADRPDALCDAVDISAEALAVAKENAALLQVGCRVCFHQADLLTDDPLEGEYDLILSNPPYIPSADIALYPSLCYEPQIALDGGTDGMDFYRALLARFAPHLKDSGAFLFEIGFDQGDAIRTLADSMGFSCTVTKDYGGNDRVARVWKANE